MTNPVICVINTVVVVAIASPHYDSIFWGYIYWQRKVLVDVQNFYQTLVHFVSKAAAVDFLQLLSVTIIVIIYVLTTHSKDLVGSEPVLLYRDIIKKIVML